MPTKLTRIEILLTDAQIEIIKLRFPDAEFAPLRLRFPKVEINKLRVYHALDLDPPEHGGKREGAGRPRKKKPKSKKAGRDGS